jgi:type IV pilus assembly protein PilW
MNARTQRGMTLVELMIGAVLALVVVGIIGSVYITNKSVTRINDTVARLQDNGRFEVYLLSDDVRMAGFRGACGTLVPPTNVLNTPTAYPYQFDVGLAGYHGTGASWSPALDGSISGLTPAPLPDRDVVTVRRVEGAPLALVATMASNTDNLTVSPGSALAVGDLLLVADCEKAAIFQATGYGGGVIAHAAGAGAPGNATANLGKRFGPSASVYRLVTRTYFIAASVRKPGTNSLWLNRSPAYDGGAQPEEIVEGVEQLRLMFGEDLDGDRAANRYVSAENVASWDNVVSVRLQTLLATTLANAATSPQPYTFDGATTTPTDRRMRTAFNSVITLRNRVP